MVPWRWCWTIWGICAATIWFRALTWWSGCCSGGCQVLVLDAQGQLTSLSAVGDVVTTGDFVQLFLNDLWHTTRSIRKTPQRAAAEMDAECVV